MHAIYFAEFPLPKTLRSLMPAHTRGLHAGTPSPLHHRLLTNTDRDDVHVALCLFIINTASTRQIKHALDHCSMLYSTCFRVGQLLLLLATFASRCQGLELRIADVIIVISLVFQNCWSTLSKKKKESKMGRDAPAYI